MPRRRRVVFNGRPACPFTLQLALDTRRVVPVEQVRQSNMLLHRFGYWLSDHIVIETIGTAKDPAFLWLLRSTMVAVLRRETGSNNVEWCARNASFPVLRLCVEWGLAADNPDLLLVAATLRGTSDGIRVAISMGATRISHALVRAATDSNVPGMRRLRRVADDRLSRRDYQDAAWHVRTYRQGWSSLEILERWAR